MFQKFTQNREQGNWSIIILIFYFTRLRDWHNYYKTCNWKKIRLEQEIKELGD